MSMYKLPELRDFSPRSPTRGTVVQEAITTTDPVLFELEAKARGHRYPRTPNVMSLKPRRLSHSSKPFAPDLGQVGSWVTFERAGVQILGQVWAIAPAPRHVWVATGLTCHSVHIGDLYLAAEDTGTTGLAA